MLRTMLNICVFPFADFRYYIFEICKNHIFVFVLTLACTNPYQVALGHLGRNPDRVLQGLGDRPRDAAGPGGKGRDAPPPGVGGQLARRRKETLAQEEGRRLQLNIKAVVSLERKPEGSQTVSSTGKDCMAADTEGARRRRGELVISESRYYPPSPLGQCTMG